jgi:hypothetical protein
MDKPADPATPLKEVYQAFYADLAKAGTMAVRGDAKSLDPTRP